MEHAEMFFLLAAAFFMGCAFYERHHYRHADAFWLLITAIAFIMAIVLDAPIHW